MNKKLKPLLKLILIYLVYFVYTTIITSVLKIFGISNEIVLVFIADLVFFIGITILYKNDLKDGYNKFVKKYSFSKKILFVLKWVAILFGINIIGGIITELLIPNLLEDGNTTSIYSFASISTVYTVFKTLVFAPIAEELVFKKTIRELISNNIIFIITSSLVYALMNIMYTDITLLTIIDMISYFMFSCVLSYIYVKNDDNIVMSMIIKLFYNLIPLVLMIISIGA